MCGVVVLVLALALQFVLPDAPMEQSEMRLPRILHTPPPVAAVDYPAVTRAPIFAPDRMPDPNDQVATDAAQPLVLLGVAREGDKFVALIRGSDGTTQRVLTGATIEGWRLAAAGPAQITLERNGEQRIVPVIPGRASAPVVPKADNDDDADAPTVEDEDDSQ